MSDMSFKQAKELVEKMEFSEIALRKAVKDLDKSSKIFEETLKQQEEILTIVPKADKKLSWMKLVVGINIGFILGLLVGKYIL